MGGPQLPGRPPAGATARLAAAGSPAAHRGQAPLPGGQHHLLAGGEDLENLTSSMPQN